MNDSRGIWRISKKLGQYSGREQKRQRQVSAAAQQDIHSLFSVYLGPRSFSVHEQQFFKSFLAQVMLNFAGVCRSGLLAHAQADKEFRQQLVAAVNAGCNFVARGVRVIKPSASTSI